MASYGKVILAAVIFLVADSIYADLPGQGPRLGEDRITQAEIESGTLSLRDIRRAGMEMFSTPFNKLDGYGDGPMNPLNTTDPGGRPTLQNNGTFLRVNGLDGQTCFECHSIISNATVPATLEPPIQKRLNKSAKQRRELFGHPLDSMFTTARLWGVADTAPYLHDGRALTLNEAILMHGGEAQTASDQYAALDEEDKAQLLEFLLTLRTPRKPANDLTARSKH